MKSKIENTDNSLYIKEAHLSGYKSIKDVKIDFKNGLNIIIGKNAVGKTNFLTFLSKALTGSFDELMQFYSKLIIADKEEISVINKSEIKKDKSDFFERDIITKLEKKGKEITEVNIESIGGILHIFNTYFATVFIRHGIPKRYDIVDEAFNFSDDINQLPAKLFSVLRDMYFPHVIKELFAIFMSDIGKYDNVKKSDIIKSIGILNREIRKVISYVTKYTPIEDFRISENYNIFVQDKTDKVNINNLFLEFKIENSWYPFPDLSDGTKRIFYIILEVAYPSHMYFTYSGFGSGEDTINRIILIEEPELGIHPHQLHNLMTFLKEMSKDRQIIISTHSPQVLNILEKDELDRIIIASSEGKEGTKMRHLDNEEISKAQKYMEEDFLSDYWIYSDLEKE